VDQELISISFPYLLSNFAFLEDVNRLPSGFFGPYESITDEVISPIETCTVGTEPVISARSGVWRDVRLYERDG
jgi:hypothetical protein